jgi:hypothetical protein
MEQVKRFHFTINASAFGQPSTDQISFVTLTEESLEKVRNLVMKELLAYNQKSTFEAKDVTSEHAQHVNELVIETGVAVHSEFGANSISSGSLASDNQQEPIPNDDEDLVIIDNAARVANDDEDLVIIGADDNAAKYPCPPQSPVNLAEQTESFKSMVEALKNNQQPGTSRFKIKQAAFGKEPEKMPKFRYVQPTSSAMPAPVFSNFFSKTKKMQNQYDFTDVHTEPVTFKKPVPPKRKSLNLDASEAAAQLSGFPLAESNSTKGLFNIS